MFGMCEQCQKDVVGFYKKNIRATISKHPPFSPFSENAEYHVCFRSKREEHLGHQAVAVRFPTVFHRRCIGLQMLS